MGPVVWINGRVCAPADATVSVFDRGFLYGDSVYETIRVHRTICFAGEAHAERLAGSAARIGWRLPWSAAELLHALEAAVVASGLAEASLRLVATRGSGPLGLDPALAKDPQLIAMVNDLPALPAAWYDTGRSAWLVTPRGRSVDPLAKTGNYMHSLLALSEAKGHGADDAIMLDPDGQVTESTVANVFALVGGRWRTPPLEAGILSGITRKTLLEVGPRGGVPIAEAPLPARALRRATEVFFSSSVREVVPVTHLDGAPVGDGRVGEGTRRLHRLYREALAAYVEARLRARGPVG